MSRSIILNNSIGNIYISARKRGYSLARVQYLMDIVRIASNYYNSKIFDSENAGLTPWRRYVHNILACGNKLDLTNVKSYDTQYGLCRNVDLIQKLCDSHLSPVLDYNNRCIKQAIQDFVDFHDNSVSRNISMPLGMYFDRNINARFLNCELLQYDKINGRLVFKHKYNGNIFRMAALLRVNSKDVK